MSGFRKFGSWCWWYRNQLIAILTPLVFLPLPLVLDDKAAICAYGMIIVTVYWCTQCIPLYITGLMPIFLLPLMEIMTPAEVASHYYRDVALFVLGTMMLALAIEHVGLHKRAALFALNLFGGSQRKILAGLVSVSAFISLWISDVSAVAILLTILDAVFEETDEQPTDSDGNDISAGITDQVSLSDMSTAVTVESTIDGKPGSELPTVVVGGVTEVSVIDMEPSGSSLNISPEPANAIASKPSTNKSKHHQIAMTQAVLYGSRLGGTAILTGSPANLIIVDFIAGVYEEHGMESPLTWTKWAMVFIPVSAIGFVLVHIWVQIYSLGWKSLRHGCKSEVSTEKEKRMMKIIREHYENLEPISYAEVMVLILFICVVLLWFFEDPGFMEGWSSFFSPGYTSASMPAILISVLMFVIPQNAPWASSDRTTSRDKPATLLEWNIVHHKMIWGFILMAGGGSAMANGARVSGLVDWIGNQMQWLKELPLAALVFVLTFFTSIFTEFTSFFTVVAIFLPFIGTMAVELGYSPLMLMLPCGLGAGYSVMLPQAGTVVSVVYSFNRVRIREMVQSGIAVELVFCFTVTLGLCTWGMSILELDTIPWDLAKDNLTVTTPIP